MGILNNLVSKSIKEIYIPAKIIIPCQFITDPLNILRIIFYPHVKPDFSVENESTMCTDWQLRMHESCHWQKWVGHTTKQLLIFQLDCLFNNLRGLRPPWWLNKTVSF